MVLPRKPRQRDATATQMQPGKVGEYQATKKKCLVRKWIRKKKDFPGTWLEIFTLDDLWHICGGSQNDFTVN